MPKQKGGKLKAKEVKDFLNASYDKTPPNDLDGYILDKSLSTATAKVYYNPQTNHAVVAHRGTQGTLDWGNNLAYALGAYEYTSRYKQGKSVQDKAEKKYGKSNISTLGHSQGAILARKLGTDTKEVINVNPAYTFEKPAKNEYNVRSSTDVVSGLYAPVAKTREILFPKYSEKHDITIPSQSATDVLGEHSYNILDRLGDKEIGVGAGNKISYNNIMKAGKRYSRLGYSGEDIDWIGGGVITTDNNCGAVGTPYVNKGTNPYGTRGAGRDSDSESSSDEEMEGGKKNPFKSVSKAFNKVGKAFEPVGQALSTGAEYANPMMWALKDKDTSKAMAQSGEITHDYLLPAVVSAGKPIYDATAIVGSTMLTGNPVLGKAVADTLWNEMVAKPGYDPRQNQKSAELGELSSTFGQAVSKPYSAALGGYRLKAGMNGRTIGERFEDWWSPPKDDDAYYERTTNRRIRRAEQEEIDALAQARELRRRAEELERNAPITRQQKEKSAREYGKNWDIMPREEAETIMMRDEDKKSRKAKPVLEKQAERLKEEREIERDEPDWAMSGHGRNIDFEKVKWGTFTRMFKEFKKENPKARVKDLEAFAHRIIKNKKKFSPKAFKKAEFYLNVIKKGGASREQIGQASIMRSYGERGTNTYKLLSDIVHSADKIDKYNSIYRDLMMRPNAEIAHILTEMEPSFFNQLYYHILNTEDQRSPEVQAKLTRILKMYPMAKRGIPRGQRWGENDPVVQQALAKIRAKGGDESEEDT